MIRKFSLAKDMFSTKVPLAKSSRLKTGAAHLSQQFLGEPPPPPPTPTPQGYKDAYWSKVNFGSGIRRLTVHHKHKPCIIPTANVYFPN